MFIPSLLYIEAPEDGGTIFASCFFCSDREPVAKILIAEDDLSLGMSLKLTLENEKHVVELVEDGSEALDRLKLYSYELVILDIDLPSISGIEVARQYRDKRGSIPILMLTGKTTISDKASGFDAGADDYLTKPFDTRELLMRIQALLRRPRQFSGDCIEVGNLKLDTKTRSAQKGGERVNLTAKEFELLEFLMKRPDQFFSVDDLLNEIWTSESESSELAARQLVRRLRKKIEKDGEEPYIITSKGLGYKFRQFGD